MSRILEQLLELHRGQGKELYWRDTVQCPTEEEYERMAQQSMLYNPRNSKISYYYI